MQLYINRFNWIKSGGVSGEEDGDSSEDEDDEGEEAGESDGDNVTLVDLHQSTMTLCVEGADQSLPEDTPAFRLAQV